MCLTLSPRGSCAEGTCSIATSWNGGGDRGPGMSPVWGRGIIDGHELSAVWYR